MSISENDFVDVINSYTKEKWKPLLDLIPIIEKVEKFGDCSKAMKLLEKGIFDMSPCIEHEIIHQFREVVYSIPIMIGFDWSLWTSGNEIVHNDNFDFDTIDIPTKCKAITAFVRGDRFCSNVVLDKFEKGVILKILKSIERQLP